MSEHAGEDFRERAEAYLRHRLRGLVRGVRVKVGDGGVVLQGQAPNYHAKQLSQHVAMKELRLTILANKIEVHPIPFSVENDRADEEG
jgi:osmotically-inducible protein OsmY